MSEALSAQFYLIIADEVTNVASQKQLLLCLHYVHNDCVQEVFVDFIEVERITGEALGIAILNRLAEWMLPIGNLHGQCYDGASNMSGARGGCKSIVIREALKAIMFIVQRIG